MDGREMRAADADRERVAEHLRAALSEGRLTLDEYDDRLREAYAARTYADLDQLLADLPAVAPTARSQVVPAAAQPVPATVPLAGNPVREWLRAIWGSWLTVVSINVLIWGVLSLALGEVIYFWPFWVAVPWGIVLLVMTVSGLKRGEPQRWAAKKARKDRKKDRRRNA